MILPIEFIFVAAAIRLIGGFSYLKATIAGKARPYPLSWLLWGITPMIAFAAELRSGVGLPALVTFALGLSPLLVFAVAIFKHPKSLKLDFLNIICVLVALGGIILWYLTDEPVLAISISIVADIFSAIPTIRKILQHPDSEHAPTYMLSVLSMIITFMTIQKFTPEAVLFPGYVLLVNMLIVVLITTRKR